MKTMYALCLGILLTGFMQAQSVSQTVLANSGATISGASNTLSFTLGEPVIGLITNGESLGQGFWLSSIEEILLSNDDFELESSTSVFPNPVRDVLSISFQDLTGQDFRIAVHDILGRTVLEKEITSSSSAERLSLGGLTSGTYLVQLIQKNTQNSKTFKIIKL